MNGTQTSLPEGLFRSTIAQITPQYEVSTMSYAFCRGTRAVVFCTALVMPAILAAAAPSAPAAEVNITKFAFDPKEITVSPGTKITWTNRDETPHTVTSSDKTFSSKGLDTADKFEHVFASEGDFSYFCTVHPFMTGVVHVRKP